MRIITTHFKIPPLFSKLKHKCNVLYRRLNEHSYVTEEISQTAIERAQKGSSDKETHILLEVGDKNPDSNQCIRCLQFTNCKLEFNAVSS